ncbi:LytR/AlgR family response regulator transcription factor [Microbulbifer sp.]|uniref:LytR/AlgR family response regulator transcription factor n=1 Tax=Microbulbifer sp. TaxID=1908541 RepID=UPI003F3AE956
MPSAIIADDEPLLRAELREFLAELWPELQLLGEFADGASALLAIERQRPDIAFLDIRIPKLDGLEVAERIQGSSQVVFVTAYDEHAIAAFEQGAADYLLKPVKHARLAATVQRLRERLADKERESRRLQWIQASLGNSLRFIAVADIRYFRSDGKYTRVATTDGDALIRRSLSTLLDSLDPEIFWQINRGIVVNVQHIHSVVRDEDGSMTARLHGDLAELPVSRAHQYRFRGM